jgi:hypothetical protein
MSYEPSSGVLPMVTVDPTAAIILPEYIGRWAFLSALQTEAPAFWLELHRLREDADGVAAWMARSGVVDEWLTEVIWSTVMNWKQRQTSHLAPGPGKRWWRYPLLDEGQVRIPLFSPRFTDPCLRGATGTIEAPEVFEARIRAEFDTQLAEYMRYLRSIAGEDHTEMKKHSMWTASAFTGVSYTKIAGKWHHLDQSYEPDAAVKMAVRRFCDRIGLTLPRRRGRYRGA